MMEWDKESGEWTALTLILRSGLLFGLESVLPTTESNTKSLDELSECRTIAHFIHLNILLGIS